MHQEAGLRLVEAVSDLEATEAETVETEVVVVEDVDLVAAQTRMRRRSGSQSPSLVVS
jgi:hypothetical protein